MPGTSVWGENQPSELTVSSRRRREVEESSHSLRVNPKVAVTDRMRRCNALIGTAVGENRVGVPRLELGDSWSQTMRATDCATGRRLHNPYKRRYNIGMASALRRVRLDHVTREV